MTLPDNAPILVAGHICVDIIPAWPANAESLATTFVPGKLNLVGPAVVSTGGAVSNTGIALHRLGMPVQLMGKVGPDLFGRALLDVIRSYAPTLTDGMIVDPDADSSYTLVINPPGVDRIFLHCPGANDTFSAADVDLDKVRKAPVFHFGYPPLMRRMYLNDGAELAALLAAVQSTGATTSLDMAQPDPASEAGRVNWRRLLEAVLPQVDLFVPSLDEIRLMLGPPYSHTHPPDLPLLQAIAAELLGLGAAVVALKLGDAGLYLRTTPDPQRLTDAGHLLAPLPDEWLGRELLTPCFQSTVAGTTGAGDCTIAGLLASLRQGASPEQALSLATAVGAASVESPDATGGVPSWSALQARLAAGWTKHPLPFKADGWQADQQIWHSPLDTRPRVAR
jgi:sugar/nucleoside kinase (ribokinase family)